MKKRIAVTTALILALTVPSAFSAGQYSPVFDKVNSPQDVKKLNTSEMNILAKDIRTAILNKVNTTGVNLIKPRFRHGKSKRFEKGKI